MTAKRLVLMILCVLLAVMIVLFAVVGAKFAPILSLLKGFGSSGTTTGPNSTAGTTNGTTTAPTQSTTVAPTVQPTTQPTEPPTTAPTEPPHEHSYSVSKVVKASCGSPGYTVYECSCGKTDIRDYVEGKSHVFDTGTKVEATCEEQGYTEFICSNCGFVDKRNYVDAIGHDYQLVEVWEPECDHDGYELYRCTNCDGEKKENEVPAPGHICEDWAETVAPGPDQPGEESGLCTACGEIVTRIPQLKITARYKATQDDLWSYTVYVGTNVSPKAIEYIIHDYSHGTVTFTYHEDGLVVSLNGIELTTLAAYQNVSLTIDADGNIVGGEAPQPSVPEEPTEPSEPITPPEEEDEP